MTKQDLEQGNKLMERLNELSKNISLLNDALGHNSKTISKFFFSCKGKNKIHIDGGFTSFGGYLTVDRECMELILNYFKNKLAETNAEFESIGKGEESEDTE